MPVVNTNNYVEFYTDPNGVKHYVRQNVSFSDGSSVGCFSRLLLYIKLFEPSNCYYVDTVTSSGAPSKKEVQWPGKQYLPNGDYSPVYRKYREFIYSLKTVDEESREIGAETLLRYLDNGSTGLFILGDNIRDTQYDTSWFVSWLIKNKCGSITCSPAVINPTHANDERLCMAWFWVPPKNCNKALPVEDCVPVSLDRAKVLPRIKAPEFISKHKYFWAEKLKYAKPAPVAKRVRMKKVGELNQVSDV
jgi:hypothetical protein